MTPGLAFLSKKSFHTANISNQEKVWIAEQKKAAEDSKTKELARQIQMEREREELDRITNKNSTRRDRGINWMYEEGGGAALENEIKAKKAEEFLLGKSFVPEQNGNGRNETKPTEGVDAAINNISLKVNVQNGYHSSQQTENIVLKTVQDSTNVNSMLEESAFDRNEEFRLRHEDPMWAVLQQQQEKKEELDKKKSLFEKVLGSDGYRKVSHSQLQCDRRQEKSDRHRKSRKREKKRSRYDDRHRRNEKKRSRRKRRSRSRSRSQSRSRSESNERQHRSHHRESRHSERKIKHRTIYHQHSPDKEEQRRSRSRKDTKINRSESRSTDSETNRERKNTSISNLLENEIKNSSNKISFEYGLLNASQTRGRSSLSLGPDENLLKKKRQERDEQKKTYRNNTRRRTLTAEEKAEALRQMQSNATRRDEALQTAIASKNNESSRDDETNNQTEAKGIFLHDVATRAHGIRNNNNNSKTGGAARYRYKPYYSSQI